jgi:hypothetical protein
VRASVLGVDHDAQSKQHFVRIASAVGRDAAGGRVHLTVESVAATAPLVVKRARTGG